MGDNVWIWGAHAVSAALANPRRKTRKLLVSRNAAQRLGVDPDALPKHAELVEPKLLDERLPDGAVHQGVALLAAQLQPVDIDDMARSDGPIAILDQITDPQNVGAVLRSAAAFGLTGVVLQTRHAPAFGGPLAKAAAGAVENIAEARVVNIARAIETLKDAGWRVIGLDGTAETPLHAGLAGDGKLAIVLGAEGSGLRRLVAESCTLLVRIPMAAGMESLNVSNAAAIAFYESQQLKPH